MGYLIEFRFQGKAKSEIKQLANHLISKFNLYSKKPIPHVTFAGPLSTRDERKLIRDFIEVCSKTPFCSFGIHGYNFFEDSRVIFIRIDPSGKLKEFRWNLSRKIQSYCKLQKYDYEKEFIFHATLAMKLTPQKFQKIRQYILKFHPPSYKHFLIRATLVKNQSILCEYDFLQRKVLTRNQALDKRYLDIDRDLLQKFFADSYNPDNSFGEEPYIPEEILSPSLLSRILNAIKSLFGYFSSFRIIL
jgi:2'-5' RNA ligase